MVLWYVIHFVLWMTSCFHIKGPIGCIICIPEWWEDSITAKITASIPTKFCSVIRIKYCTHHIKPKSGINDCLILCLSTSLWWFLPCVVSLPVLLLSLHSSASAALLHPWCVVAQLPGASGAATNNDRFPLHYYCYIITIRDFLIHMLMLQQQQPTWHT